MWKRDVLWFTLALVLIVAAVVVGNNIWRQRGEGDEAEGQHASGPDYSNVPATWVGREACVECHADADSLWHGSDHDRSMQVPSPAVITANFDNATYEHFGITSTFYRDGDTYMVRTDGPDGEMTDLEVAYLFGYTPLEQFLIRFPDGRMQCLNVCWASLPAEEDGQRWFHLYPGDPVPASDLFHWTGMLQNWNYMCAECHSTNLRRNFDDETNTYNTTWSELNVSCEACHGPGSRHVLWEQAYARKLRPRNDDGLRGMVASMASPDSGAWYFEPDSLTAKRSEPLASRAEVEACARCHTRRSQLTAEFEYGQPFLDHYRPELLRENLYHADGQNADEVYVWGSFVQSKMYAAGVTCSDCHDYHTTKTNGTGNQVCARCHRAEFYDTKEHHFHKPGEGGDSCLDCHQQARKVMVVDARRDHSFRIPRPDLSLELGTPNACSDCHTDKSHQWNQDAIVKWYGADRQQGPHYAEAIHAGRTGSPGALDVLQALVADAEQPGMIRATALTLVPRYAPGADLPEVRSALADEDPLVRLAAVDALIGSTPEAQFELVAPLLQDPVRAVRIAAAAVVANLPTGMLAPDDPDLVRAIDIHLTYLDAIMDRPESLLQRAAFLANRGDRRDAEAAYRLALEREPRLDTCYVNYADFLRSSNRDADGERVLRAGVDLATEPGNIHFALGLLLVRDRQMTEAIEHLRLAVEQRPDEPHYGYVLAVGLATGGDYEAALGTLENVIVLHPWHAESLQTLALYALESQQPQRGREAAAHLLELYPEDPGAQALFARVDEASESRDR